MATRDLSTTSRVNGGPCLPCVTARADVPSERTQEATRSIERALQGGLQRTDRFTVREARDAGRVGTAVRPEDLRCLSARDQSLIAPHRIELRASDDLRFPRRESHVTIARALERFLRAARGPSGLRSPEQHSAEARLVDLLEGIAGLTQEIQLRSRDPLPENR